jgi:AraC-like DNA-binding protein
MPVATLRSSTWEVKKIEQTTASGMKLVGFARREPSVNPKSALAIEQTVAFMVQHLKRPMRIADLAAQANVSSSYFFALFKRQVGSAPMDYLTRLRMQRACELLEGTSWTIKMIAYETGYRDSLYFSRVFKLLNRVAPSRYRMALQKTTGDALAGRGGC